MDLIGFNLHRVVVIAINIIVVWQLLVVFTSSKNKIVYKAFVAMSISMLIWVDLAYMARIVSDITLSTYILKLSWTGALPFSLFILYFTLNLLQKRKSYKLLLKLGIILTILFSLITLFSNVVVSSVNNINGNFDIVYGIGMIPFLGTVSFIIIATFYVLIITFKKSDYQHKLSLIYFSTGLSLFCFLNIIFNITLPILFGITKYYYFGDYSTLIMLLLVSYSIVRYQFLGTNVVFSTFLISIIGIFQMVDIGFLSRGSFVMLIKIIIFILYLIVAYLLIHTILNDIRQDTIIRKSNKSLNISKSRFSNLAREQKDIIDIMGHEIRTPLTAIVQEMEIQKKIVYPHWAKLISGKLANKDRLTYLSLVKDTLDTTGRASSHALALVGDMLETARLDKKRFHLNYSKFDLIKLVKDAVRLMSKTTTDRSIHIIFKSKLKSLEVNADSIRINEAVLALLSNSIKYKDENKTYTNLKVSITRKKGKAFISVCDNGIGMAKEDIKKLGKKFVRLYPKLNGNLKRPGGTGLGLFVVSGIMQHHNGVLNIMSDGLYKGATFTLGFPIDKLS